MGSSRPLCICAHLLCELQRSEGAARAARFSRPSRRRNVMRIGWLGLGNMGLPMAGRLVDAGHEVLGYDVTAPARRAAASRGITVADSVADAVTGADAVFTMLPNGAVVREVLVEHSALVRAPARAVFIDCSTIDIADAHDLHTAAVSAGRRFLDAPVSGGVGGAAGGSLTFMVGGDAEVLATVRSLVQAMAGRIVHVGGPGAGQAAKIVNNMMLGINLAGLCEGAVLAERLGLDAATFQSLAAASSGDSWALRTWYPAPGVVQSAAVNRDFDGGFAADLLAKDLRLALQAGERTGTPLPHATAVAEAMHDLHERGHGGKDCTVLVRSVAGSW
ncbi:3-hydroxyisobutyrate dehydrogenase [Nocardioides sp. IC4_145]|uniref:3-hydroxyisobutyrate dehydrogenase n=1 Tax=Nocardioides sp. IC4_145 TaxID=2714037 RepID=UPI00140731E3|nr:3-hydroxyisobutyrate dehydrogenase [Nocardioides sp. IC4_145]NHC21909.1 3-hydroxyisobutyrate dehydrogenase [Nocardioides sp. IC4_145]